jgi:tryptophan-rich sensory protein
VRHERHLRKVAERPSACRPEPTPDGPSPPRAILHTARSAQVGPVSAHAGRVGRNARTALRRPQLPLLAWLGLCIGGGLLTALEFPPDAWYRTLVRPDWSAPDLLFAPVWTVLYVLMAIAAWRIDRLTLVQRAYALRLFFVQLALNFAWTPIFFGGHALGASVAVIGVLWLAIVATLLAFSRLDRLAGVLLLPYLAWVTYAAALDFAIWTMNRAAAA